MLLQSMTPSGNPLEIESPLPRELLDVLQMLREKMQRCSFRFCMFFKPSKPETQADQ